MENPGDTPSPGTVVPVPVPGLWMTPHSWEGWRRRFEADPGWEAVAGYALERALANAQGQPALAGQ